LAKHEDRIHGVILGVLTLVVAAAVAWVLWQGLDFYRTPLDERPHHEDFRALRPAGRIGHGLGIVGSVMVVVLLLYSLRKRWKPLARIGQLRHWLRYHIFLGVAGPVLITLHTSFKIDGLVSVSYWSMAAVVLSGVFGRYLYQQIPRNVLGEALAPAAVEERNEALLVDLSDRWGADQRALDDLDRLALGPLEGRPAPAALLLAACSRGPGPMACRMIPGCAAPPSSGPWRRAACTCSTWSGTCSTGGTSSINPLPSS
jgi:hypothetical protein